MGIHFKSVASILFVIDKNEDNNGIIKVENLEMFENILVITYKGCK